MTRGGADCPGDAEKRAHLDAGDFLFVENFNGERFPGHGFGLFGHDARRKLLAGSYEVAREVLCVSDRAAFERPLSQRRARVGEADNLDESMFFRFSCRFVFVRFKMAARAPSAIAWQLLQCVAPERGEQILNGASL